MKKTRKMNFILQNKIVNNPEKFSEINLQKEEVLQYESLDETIGETLVI